MPVFEKSYKTWAEIADRRQAKKEYWMKKGCSERKAESLLFRYGY